MIAENMAEALANMQLGRHKPALWLLSPAALADLQANWTPWLIQDYRTPLEEKPLFGLPWRLVDTWSWGWQLVSEAQARKMGVKL